jgi:hypothetical protein
MIQMVMRGHGTTHLWNMQSSQQGAKYDHFLFLRVHGESFASLGKQKVPIKAKAVEVGKESSSALASGYFRYETVGFTWANTATGTNQGGQVFGEAAENLFWPGP